jgi:hypothetical protein
MKDNRRCTVRASDSVTGAPGKYRIILPLSFSLSSPDLHAMNDKNMENIRPDGR